MNEISNIERNVDAGTLRIVVIGQGKVGTHLSFALASAGADCLSVSSRNFPPLPSADLYIIAVSDDAIPTVSEALGQTNIPVVHTSGTVPVEALKDHESRGVFYPLQTFSTERQPDFSRITFCLEASDALTLEAMKRCAALLGADVLLMASEHRARLHFAAVVASNFCNHLWAMSAAILDSPEALSILKPLIEETLEKAAEIGPRKAQTGPAVRGDKSTLSRQQKMADALDFPLAPEIYRILSQSITKYHSSDPATESGAKVKSIDS